MKLETRYLVWRILRLFAMLLFFAGGVVFIGGNQQYGLVIVILALIIQYRFARIASRLPDVESNDEK